ncbi:hypothetical protein P3T76_003000 [Phytophthora citrophthora]|uniref:Uncharacterized protein n=1 Tax=Phytophthora citrophthora TaxID=4793 RepID=A0AAD9LSX0_9STRA|nr:hypothetical protein P3T76_003000 [Phytophthora citrophthora]
MGCCPSKPPALGKEYAVNATEVAPILPSTVSGNQVELKLDDAVDEMTMDRGEEISVDDEEPVPEEEKFKLPLQKTEAVLNEVLIRNPETTTSVQSPPSPPPKTSRNADDIPISSTYHRVHSAEVAEQEAKRQEELRLEAERREQEIREYKAAIGLSY